MGREKVILMEKKFLVPDVPMKVIFLDIDGVLNCMHCKTKIDGFNFIMDEKIELLKQLVERTGAKIVLSSTWRFGWAYMEAPGEKDAFQQREIRHFLALKEKLHEFGLELMDYTPVINEGMNHRGEEIAQWLKEWEGEPIESFVILDDLNGKYLRPYSDKLARTPIRKGLEQRHVDLAVKILEKPFQ